MALAKRLLLGFWTIVAGAALACALLPATALAADVELAVTFNDDSSSSMADAITSALAASGAPAKASVTAIKVTGAATSITDGNWEALRACFTENSGWTALKNLNFKAMPNIESVGFSSPPASASTPSKLVNVSFSWQNAQPKTIGNYAFQNCVKLYSISFGNIVETIGEGAFYDCKTLTLSDLPPTIKTIGKEAFRGCKLLRLSAMPKNAEVISEGAFQGCTDLKYMRFPASVKTIGSRAFDITYPNGTRNCLTQLTFAGEAPTVEANDAFGSYSAGMLICEEAYVSGFDGEWMQGAFGDNASNWSLSFADWPLTVRGGVEDEDWSWSENNTVLTIKTAKPVIVSGVANNLNEIEEKNARIVVDCGEGTTANVTLSSVNIKTDKGSALQVLSGALDLKLETAHIAAQNPVKLVSSAGAGIEHGTRPLALSVTNADEGITIESTNGGAGIGGVDVDGRRDAGNFTLSAGAGKTITVKGAPGCAGIGGATGGSATNMSFTEDGAALAVTGGAAAAAIGGGKGGSASDMRFLANRGRTVAATGGGAAIGGGKGGNASDLLFEDGTYELTVSDGGAGVGAGSGGSASNIVIQEGGGTPKTSCDFKVTGTPAFSDGVKITAGSFGDGDTSQGMVYGFKVAEGYAVVDSGFASHPYKVVSAKNPFAVEGGAEGSDWSYDIANSTLKLLTTKPLTISMADGVDVTDACIQVECPTVDDTAHLTINGLNIDKYASSPAFGVKRGKLDLELVGDNVLASPLSCGLGNANEIDNKLVLTISGEGSLVAKGGEGGAGIGGHSNGKTDNDIRSIESITIKGGTITASGSHCGIGGAGAGSGGGVGEGGRIVIEGGTVTAEGLQATGIGSGSTAAPAEVVITGGKVTAKGQVRVKVDNVYTTIDAPIEKGAEISGGYFGAGDAAANTVYDITPLADFKVYANEGANKGEYPVYVTKASTPGSTTYPVVEGNGETWERDADGGMRFKIDAPLDKFLDVAVDGTVVVRGCDYDATSGSTVIVLRPSYLATLAAGMHTLDVTFADGSSQATFTIAGTSGPNPGPTPPAGNGNGNNGNGGDADDANGTSGAKLAPTGDPLGTAAGTALALAALAVAALVLVRRRG